MAVAGWLFAVFAVWAIASPLMGVPDEPAHTIKAASVWQGDLRGTPVEVGGRAGMSGDGTVTVDRVRVPEAYASTAALPSCFAFQAHVSVECAPDMVDSGRVVETNTMAGPYPPLYYALVGWPTRLVHDATGVYLMRLTSALLGALLVAFGLRSMSRLLPVSPVLVGFSVLITPMVPFLVGAVNPAGMEISASVLFWSAAIALVFTWDRDGEAQWGLVSEFLVGLAVLALARPLGVLFCAFAMGGVMVFAGWRRCRDLLGDRRLWAVAGGAAAIVGLAITWMLLKAGTTSLPGAPLPEGARPLLFLWGETDDFLRQMVAVFGWKDTGPVVVVVAAWMTAGSLLLAVVLLLADLWQRFVVLMGAVAVVMLPIAMQLPTLSSEGLAWQGRYLLPFAVGIPLLAVVAVAGRLNDLPRGWRAVAVGIVVLCQAGTVVGLYAWLFRAVGSNPWTLNPFRWQTWDPPLSSGFLLLLSVVLAAIPIVIVWRGTAPATSSGDPDTFTIDPPRADAEDEREGSPQRHLHRYLLRCESPVGAGP